MRLFLMTAPMLAMMAAVGASAQDQTPHSQPDVLESPTPQIDFPAFVKLTGEVAELREQRLLPKDVFLEQALADGALLLDTRSAEAFRLGHIEGAVNLPFSDFTDEKLAKVIGENRDRPIYIYCNNNFSDNVEPIGLKAAPLALNIPTFINLVGYGYANVWELDGVMTIAEVPWQAEPMFAQLKVVAPQTTP